MDDKNIKNNLFENFYWAAKGTFEELQDRYAVNGLVCQVFGEEPNSEGGKQKFRASHAWTLLMELYDYALHGAGHPEPESLVINCANTIDLAKSEDFKPSEFWDELVATADGRVALDGGDPVMLEKVALLAKVDVRTVRNAISAGTLEAFKDNGTVYVANASARRWLLGRKGFAPTDTSRGASRISLEAAATPHAFGVALVARRIELGISTDHGVVAVLHSRVTPETLRQLEAGLFSVPLDAVFPIADFYQFNRKIFLECVMRVFYSEQLTMLSSRDGEAA